MGFVIGLIIIAAGFLRYQAVQKLKNTPLSKVDSVAVGLAALSGRARIGNPVTSPVSGTPCVFWRLSGSYYKSTGKDRGYRGIQTVQSPGPIILEDGTGRIPVLAEGGDVELPQSLSLEGYIRERGIVFKEPANMDPRALRYIESLDPATKEIYLGHADEKILINEYVIRDGDPLYVLGSVLPAADAGAAGTGGALVVRQGTDDPALYISDSSELDLEKKLGGHLYLQILAGLVLSGFCLFLFLNAGGF